MRASPEAAAPWWTCLLSHQHGPDGCLTDATFECKEIGSTLELVSMDCWQVILLPDCSC